jgi:hypothetical protein
MMPCLAAANGTVVGQPGGGFAAVELLVKIGDEAVETSMYRLGRSVGVARSLASRMEPRRGRPTNGAPGVMCSCGGSEKGLPAVLTMWLGWGVPLTVAKSGRAIGFIPRALKSERSQVRPARCIRYVGEKRACS